MRDAVKIPLAVKIGSQFSNLTNFVPRLAQAGAKGVVLFNRFLEPDIDLETLRITPSLVLSNRHELRAPLRWIAILRDQVSISLAATSGIHFSGGCDQAASGRGRCLHDHIHAAAAWRRICRAKC